MKNIKYSLNLARRIIYIYIPLYVFFQFKVKSINIKLIFWLPLDKGYMWALFVTIKIYVCHLYNGKGIYESVSLL